MTFKQFEKVYTLVDVPAVGVRAGQSGTILDVYEGGAMEVGFDQDGNDGLVTAALQPSQVSTTPPRAA